ncbi:MAG TPA: hypothetical protein VKX39_01665 [Bryobacteraceae bacterium]|jgi:hypothetical protein|nr:hypothetical protein [Bryobacteraceae bacterium]
MTDNLTNALGVFVGIAFIALIVQLALWLAIYRLSRRVQARVEKSARGFSAMAKVSREIAAENREPAHSIALRTMEIGKTLGQDARVLGRFGSDVHRGIKHGQEHAEVVIDDARRRVHETADLVSRGVSAPLRGIARSVWKAVHFFDRRAA